MRGFAAVAVVMWFATGVLAAPPAGTTTTTNIEAAPGPDDDNQGSGNAPPRPLVRRETFEDAARKAGSQTSGRRRRSIAMEENAKERREVGVEMLPHRPYSRPPVRPWRRSTEGMTKEVVHHKAAE
ncbi:hypothetical protein L249_2760 [Ophiocordyceps polyrhachis-furcata BCC 54312]|uniref:Uncharacterized protein n=1 Tax=Ophiocordyceps polyrhachis-furcata BCC 54312 TaxID=1330021 RepID=A0A367LQR3_9HYPO|nr:hypothetical protein L249_2760 [Ophiocordyceps polyrhachis-furcata BCC 54312]